MQDPLPATRPFVFVNMAMTADGKIATFNRRVSSFGSPRDQRHLYELRAQADAVMAGARTLDANAVYLGPGGTEFRRERARRGLAEYNLRVIVSGSGSINPRAAIFQRRFSPIVILTRRDAPAVRLRRLRGLADAVIAHGTGELDFAAALMELRARWGVRRILCEGGGELNDALFRAGLVDELHLTVCPLLFGGQASPTLAEGTGARRLADAARLRLWAMKRVGGEVFLIYRARSGAARSGAADYSLSFHHSISSSPARFAYDLGTHPWSRLKWGENNSMSSCCTVPKGGPSVSRIM